MKISLNPTKFARSIAISRSKRWCRDGDENGDGIWPTLNKIGPDMVAKLIDANKPLFGVVLTNPNIPQNWKDKIAQAPQYAHYLTLITQEDVFQLLPGWFKPLVLERPNGIPWFQRECESLKLLFGGI